MAVVISPDDSRFFDIPGLDSVTHRLGPVGLFAGVRVNTVLFVEPSPSVAFLFTAEQRRAFFCMEQDLPAIIHLRDHHGQWTALTFDPDTHKQLEQACARELNRMHRP